MAKISVIMNCLNGERYVRGAIESVYAQTYADWEIIFWDNASTDRTAEIAHGFDERLRYFRSEKTIPLGAARNRAIAQATGEWIGFLDYDDLCLPNRFARQIQAVDGKDFALCYAGHREVDSNGHLVRVVLPQYGTGMIFDELLRNCEAHLQTTMVNAGYLRSFNISTCDSYNLFEDVTLFLKLAAKGPVCVVPEVVSVLRLLPTSLTAMAAERAAAEYLGLLDELRRDNPGIEVRHARAFYEAEARGLYYQAQHEMRMREFANARSKLRRISSVRPAYAALHFASYWPALWNLVHNRSVKAKLTNLLLRRGTKVDTPHGRSA